MTQPTSPDAARHSVAQDRWKRAYAEFAEADESSLGAAELEAFADTAWWTCHADQAIELRQRAVHRYLDEGNPVGAARVALSLSWDHSARGAYAVSRGWVGRAERLLTPFPDAPERALLALTQAVTALDIGEVDAGTPHLEEALRLAERHDDREVLAMARVVRGRLLIHQGSVDEGLALLDESSTAALSGELGPLVSGLVYCYTIATCQDVGDYHRAVEWTQAANRWCDGVDLTGFPGACRVHKAQVMRLHGNWTAAVEQAQAACTELREFNNVITAAGHYEVGEVRRRRGEFAAALESYREADAFGQDPQPGLSLLRLAEGRVEAALAGIHRSLDATDRPLDRVRLLPALVEVAVAAGDLDTAREALAELDRIVGDYRIADRPAPAFEAAAHLAHGQFALVDGQVAEATRSLRQAREGWRAIGAPYETAHARLLLGLAYRRSGDEDGAMGELEAALAVFERLGARLDEERAKELLGRLERRRTFMFTDIVGSTQLVETLGDEKWRRLLARHDTLLREQITAAGGEVIKQTGDGFFAAFDRPKEAIGAAVAIQRALADEVVAPDVRIGVHTGGAFHTEGEASDYGGQGVHMAARIGAAAGAGEILVSRDSVDGSGGAFTFTEPREIGVKGFSAPVVVTTVRWR